MKDINPLTCIDFYKADHRRQYPEGTQLVVSNLTPRSSKNKNCKSAGDDGIIFFGLQYFIKDFLIRAWNDNFFNKPKDDVVREYKRRMDESLGKDAIPVDHISELHDLGFLPIVIYAVPEGTFVPCGVPCIVMLNAIEKFYWLTNYLETILSSYMWLPCTSATTAFNYKMLLSKFAEITGSPIDFVDFQAHDFSFRGMSSLQSAMVSGAAHLTSFKGTDTVPAIDLVEQYYATDSDTKDIIGCSVPATEHSVMCMGGDSSELDTFERLISNIYPSGIVSIVSDTWDFWKVMTDYVPKLKNKIMSRDGKVVFRPDSGDPADILCGDPYALPGTPEKIGAVELLWNIFGGTETSTGHKLLDQHVGLIYGDSITYDLAEKILSRLHKKGFASANVVFGVGSYTYQYVTRDTWGFAVKATFGRVNGVDKEIYKDPKTDSGMKKSARGLVMAKIQQKTLECRDGVSWSDFYSDDNALKPVFINGVLHKQQSFVDIRERIKANVSY